MKRVCITGTESTGKTTLAEELAAHFKVALLPDVSRDFIASLNRPYTQQDVLEIARQIIAAENTAENGAATFYLSDNDLLNIKIWLQYYNWPVPVWLTEEIQKKATDIYLLCYIDTPWEPDAQRANPHDRNELFAAFISELDSIKATYKILKGNKIERFEQALSHIEKNLV